MCSSVLNEILKKRNYLSVTKMNDGTEVTADTWQKRREEMLEILMEHSYGYTPTVDVRRV